jgi:hypothetical protein
MVMNSVIIMRAMPIVCVGLHSAVPSTSMSNRTHFDSIKCTVLIHFHWSY